ncbi:MAG TPA: hypothetical protein VFC38_06360 [Stellaceae bacterium]|nr:hypothetical protein [Stellaceae bacterium]
MNRTKTVRTVGAFVVGQGALQAIQAVSGLVLVREMDIREYGILAFVLSVQATVSVLCDLSFRDAVIANAGSDWHNRSLLGDLVAAVWRVRMTIWVVASLGAFLALYFFHLRHGLSLNKAMVFAALISGSVFFNSWFTYFSLPLVLARDMRQLYAPQILAQAVRLAGIIILVGAGFLAASPVVALSCLAIAVAGLWYRFRHAGLFKFPERPTEESRLRLRQYVVPLLPSSIFYAFQDQITAFILTIFGQTTNIAQAFALGRLGIVFQLFGAAGTVLVIPWIARSSSAQLPRRYFAVLSFCVTLAALFIAASFVFPDAFLFVLGGNYRGLERELQIVIATMSLGFVGTMMWLMNNARRWIWSWSSFPYIGVTLAIQVTCIATLDMLVLRNVLTMSLLVALGVLGVQIFQSAMGFALKR